jgi:hypothetical protein
VIIPVEGTSSLVDCPSTNPYLTAPALDRLACNAQLTPVLTNGPGGILNIGRSQRLFTNKQQAAWPYATPAAGSPDATDTPPTPTPTT